jgi:hypothetical protein
MRPFKRPLHEIVLAWIVFMPLYGLALLWTFVVEHLPPPRVSRHRQTFR